MRVCVRVKRFFWEKKERKNAGKSLKKQPKNFLRSAGRRGEQLIRRRGRNVSRTLVGQDGVG